MMRWSRKTYLLAAIALIVLSNVVALAGVVWNRSGEPDAELKLSMRELSVSGESFGSENSGLELRLDWRVPVADGKELPTWSYGGSGGSPAWLDQAKMQELGFSLPDPGPQQKTPRTTREVYVVLELAGAAWQHHQDQVRAAIATKTAHAEQQTDIKQRDNESKQVREWREREEHEFSRLFAIDAGLDAQALRQRYPDRHQYAIVAGQITAHYDHIDHKLTLRGYLEQLRSASINVPYTYRSRLVGASGQSPRDIARKQLKGTELTVAFGQRHEPWLVDITPPAAQ